MNKFEYSQAGSRQDQVINLFRMVQDADINPKPEVSVSPVGMDGRDLRVIMTDSATGETVIKTFSDESFTVLVPVALESVVASMIKELKEKSMKHGGAS